MRTCRGRVSLVSLSTHASWLAHHLLAFPDPSSVVRVKPRRKPSPPAQCKTRDVMRSPLSGLSMKSRVYSRLNIVQPGSPPPLNFQNDKKGCDNQCDRQSVLRCRSITLESGLWMHGAWIHHTLISCHAGMWDPCDRVSRDRLLRGGAAARRSPPLACSRPIVQSSWWITTGNE